MKAKTTGRKQKRAKETTCELFRGWYQQYLGSDSVGVSKEEKSQKTPKM